MHSGHAFIVANYHHNLHQSRIPSTTSISQISHMATLLINNITVSSANFGVIKEFA